MGSGGIFHKFWCDKCQCYVDFSDFETCESICEYCEAAGRAAERAAVVAWLQEVSASSLNWRPSLVYAARSIERGDHRKEE